jgi:chromatin remodeling complex protein RSC6
MTATKKMSAPKKVSAPKKIIKKVSKTKSLPKAVEDPTPVVEPVESVDTQVINAQALDIVSNYADEFSHLLGQLQGLQNTLKELTIYTNKLQKRVAKDQKGIQKRVNTKKRRVNTSNSPSGFSKPGPISDELRKFLGLGEGELIARTEVTKCINTYCKDKGLQCAADKRILNADKTLMTLLRLNKGDELTFFNLQKYMKVHFPNKEGVYPSA